MKLYSGLHNAVFSIISVIYRLFFNPTSKKYRNIIAEHRNLLESGSNRVLDIGCGTGAFTQALASEGFDAVGTDISAAMMSKAKQMNLNCVKADILEGLPFGDNSFGTVCSAYVAHGMRPRFRKQLYAEARRIASDRVIFHDYGRGLAFFPVLIIEILETLTGGDYFGFRKNAVKEMQAVFSEVEEIPLTPSVSWYVCRP